MDISSISMLTAFLAGLVSFLSPCVLPLVPGYISYVAGQSPLTAVGAPASAQSKVSAVALSVLFVAGFSTVFITLGASATAIGRLLLSYRYEANIIGGAIIVLFGLFMTGLVPIPWLQRDLRFHNFSSSSRGVGAYGLGLAFAFGWTPCIGPILGAILTATAVSATLDSGVALLSIYSIGLGVPFLLAAIFTGAFINRMTFMRRYGRQLQIAAGLVMVIMGVAMITGYLSTFSYWLLRTFPGLGNIG